MANKNDKNLESVFIILLVVILLFFVGRGMMGYSGYAMMGGFYGFGSIVMALFIVILVLAIIWLFKQIK